MTPPTGPGKPTAMTEHPYAHLGVPDATERDRLNTAMLTGDGESDFYDGTGRPAP